MSGIQDIAIKAEEPQDEPVEEDNDADRKLYEMIARWLSSAKIKVTVRIDKLKLQLKGASAKLTKNDRMAQPLITAAEAESKIETYTAKLIASIEAANKHYIANNPSGTHTTIGNQERLLIQAKVSQTVNKYYSIAPEGIVQEARQKTG